MEYRGLFICGMSKAKIEPIDTIRNAVTRLDELMNEIQELQNAKELLDDILRYIEPNSGHIKAWGEKDERAIPSQIVNRIQRYTKFDDSE